MTAHSTEDRRHDTNAQPSKVRSTMQAAQMAYGAPHDPFWDRPENKMVVRRVAFDTWVLLPGGWSSGYQKPIGSMLIVTTSGVEFLLDALFEDDGQSFLSGMRINGQATYCAVDDVAEVWRRHNGGVSVRGVSSSEVDR